MKFDDSVFWRFLRSWAPQKAWMGNFRAKNRSDSNKNQWFRVEIRCFWGQGIVWKHSRGLKRPKNIKNCQKQKIIEFGPGPNYEPGYGQIGPKQPPTGYHYHGAPRFYTTGRFYTASRFYTDGAVWFYTSGPLKETNKFNEINKWSKQISQNKHKHTIKTNQTNYK